MLRTIFKGTFVIGTLHVGHTYSVFKNGMVFGQSVDNLSNDEYPLKDIYGIENKTKEKHSVEEYICKTFESFDGKYTLGVKGRLNDLYILLASCLFVLDYWPAFFGNRSAYCYINFDFNGHCEILIAKDHDKDSSTPGKEIKKFIEMSKTIFP